MAAGRGADTRTTRRRWRHPRCPGPSAADRPSSWWPSAGGEGRIAIRWRSWSGCEVDTHDEPAPPAPAPRAGVTCSCSRRRCRRRRSRHHHHRRRGAGCRTWTPWATGSPAPGASRRARGRAGCSAGPCRWRCCPAGAAGAVGRTATASDGGGRRGPADGPDAATAAAAVGLLIRVRAAAAAAEALAASRAPGCRLLGLRARRRRPTWPRRCRSHPSHRYRCNRQRRHHRRRRRCPA